MNTYNSDADVIRDDGELPSIEDELGDLLENYEGLFLSMEEGDTENSESEVDELDQAIAGTEFEIASAEDNDPQEISFSRYKDSARRWINRVIPIVRSNRRYAGCAPSAARAVRAFSAKRYFAALRHAYATYRCIQSKR